MRNPAHPAFLVRLRQRQRRSNDHIALIGKGVKNSFPVFGGWKNSVDPAVSPWLSEKPPEIKGE